MSMSSGGGSTDIVGEMAGYRVASEFTGSLRGSKGGGSAMPSPRKSTSKQGNLYDCFGGDGGGSGGGNSSNHGATGSMGGAKGKRKGRQPKMWDLWPTLLANLGICALLLGYIFLGSFLFLTIENSGQLVDIPEGASGDSAAIWHISQIPKASPAAAAAAPPSQQPSSVFTIYREPSSSPAEASFASVPEGYNYTRLTNASSNAMPLPLTLPSRQRHTDPVRDEPDNDVVISDRHANLMQQDQHSDSREEELERQRTVDNIWDITVSLNILYKENWTKLASMEISKFQNKLVKRLVTDLAQNPASEANPNGLLYSYRNNYLTAQNLLHVRERDRLRMRQQQKEQFKWTFATAFLYSLTVITTVGYGTIMPRTTLGRMMTIGYATFGIPLTLIYLSTIGSTLARLAQPLCTRLLCCRICRRNAYCGGGKVAMAGPMARKQDGSDKKCSLPLKQLHYTDQQYCYVRPPPQLGPSTDISSVSGGIDAAVSATASASFDTLSIATTTTTTHNTTGPSVHQWSLVIPVALCVVFLCLYVGFGSLVIALLEQWSLLDGLYFCFMSLTTIGFCDLLPGLAPGGRPSTGSGVAVWFCSIYILVGLTLTSMCVNILHEEILQRMRVVVTVQTRSSSKDSGSYLDKERDFYSAKP